MHNGKKRKANWKRFAFNVMKAVGNVMFDFMVYMVLFITFVAFVLRIA